MYEYDGKKVVIMLCSKCNINCKHCYIKYEGNFSRNNLEYLFNTLKNKYSIILNGTEPILFPEYYEFFEKNCQHSILTNGLELMRNPEIYESLKQNGITKISMSYHFGIQDDISYVKSAMLDELVKKLITNGFHVKLMTTISSDNYKNIVNMCQKAHDLGAKSIKFTNYIFQGNAQKHSKGKVLTQEQIDYVLDEIEKSRTLYNINDLKIERCGTFGPKKNNKSKFECLACNDIVIITPDLNIYQCIFDIDKGNEIGKFVDGKIMLYDEYRNVDKSYCKVLKKYNNV